MKGLVGLPNRAKIALSLLQKLAEARGTTLYKIAQKHGIKRPTIYAWAKNPRKMKVEQVELMAEELGLSPADLVAKLTAVKPVG